MHQQQQQQFARFIAVSRFCQRYARGLRIVSSGFTGQMERLTQVIARLHLEREKEQSDAVRAPTTPLSEARQALFAQLLVIARLARVVNRSVGVQAVVPIPYAGDGASPLLRTARQAEGEGHRLRETFLAYGASEDFLERLREMADRVEQCQRAGVMAREERRRMRSAIRTALQVGTGTVICLDAVVRAYCASGGERRSTVWRQWREVVPRVAARCGVSKK